ncbi:MAG: tetratricopeptide repeat protein [Bryobacteraceae bacterium]
MASTQKRVRFFAHLATIALFSSCFAAYATGTVTGPAASPNDLIAGGQYQLAADTLVQMLHDLPVSGQQDENSAALMCNLGVAYEKLGRYVEAEATLAKAIQIYKDLGITAGLSYGRALNNLANVYLSEKRYAKSEQMFKDTLALYRNQLPENDQDIALILNNLGLTRLSVGDFAHAEQYFRESLALQRKLKDDTHRLAVTLNNIALACKHAGRLGEAARIYAQAIEVWRNTAGSSHPEVAVGLHNLASLETVMGQDDAAEKHFQEALSIVDATLPPDHPNRTAIMSGYADLLLKMGRKRQAKQLQASARTLRARHNHENFQDLTVDVRSLEH